MVHTALKTIWSYRTILIILLTPLLMLPMPIVLGGTEAACGFCIIIIAIYWMTEVLPLAVTSFLPLVLFPLLGIMKASEVSMMYTKDTVWLFIGSFFIAIAVEYVDLHKRIAVYVLLVVGTSPQCLMFGFMCTTAFLSMWITNTATTAMMLPIVEAVLKELLSEHHVDVAETTDVLDERIETAIENDTCTSFSNPRVSTQTISSYENEAFDEDGDLEKAKEEGKVDFKLEEKTIEHMSQKTRINIRKGMTLCVPYSASIGGIATLTGTPPNLVLAGQFELLYPDADVTLSYGNWIAYNFPVSLTILLFAYLWMVWFYIGINKSMFGCCGGHVTERDKRVKKVILQEKKDLGEMTWAEVTVLITFILTALLWFFRDPGFIPGWSVLFKDGYVSDGTVAMTMACLLFVLPIIKPNMFSKYTIKKGPVPSVLNWQLVNEKFPWAVMFLLGGGYAIAQGSQDSGLSEWIGDQLAVLDQYADWVICLIITIITCYFTEIASNVATASIFIPIISQLANEIEIHPLYLLIPAVTCCSLAFMLPVATPPNAIAFAYGHLKVLDLVKAGFVLNILGIIIVNVYINTYGMWFYGLDQFPQWASENITTTTVPICYPAPTPAM